MEILGLEPKNTKRKFAVLPIKLYPPQPKVEPHIKPLINLPFDVGLKDRSLWIKAISEKRLERLR